MNLNENLNKIITHKSHKAYLNDPVIKPSPKKYRNY
jgi:hypothetical protein